MKSFKQYFEAPISDVELYKAAKKSTDKKMAAIAFKRKTGKDMYDTDSMEEYQTIRTEFIGAVQDLKQELASIFKNIDPTKLSKKIVLDEQSPKILMNQILPKKLIKLISLDGQDSDDVFAFVSSMTGFKKENLSIINPDSKSDKSYELLTRLAKEANEIIGISDAENIDEYIIEFELEDNNRIHFPGGIPQLLKGFGLGKILYLAVAHKVDYIFSMPNASPSAKQVWASLLTTAKDFYAFYETKSAFRGIIKKTASAKKFKMFFGSIIGEFLIAEAFLIDVARRKIKNNIAKEEYRNFFKKEPPEKFKIDMLFTELNNNLKDSPEKLKAIKTKINKNMDKKVTQDVMMLAELEEQAAVFELPNVIGLAKYKRVVPLIIEELLKNCVMDKELKQKFLIQFSLTNK